MSQLMAGFSVMTTGCSVRALLPALLEKENSLERGQRIRFLAAQL
jgi:hypothetical protein